MLPVWVFAKIAVRRSLRDKTALFFIFLFPLIFLFVFGGVFGGNTDASYRVALINQSKSAFALTYVDNFSNNKTFKVDPEPKSLAEAREKMSRGQLDAVIVLNEAFGTTQNDLPSGKARVYYTQNSEPAARTLTSVLDSQFQGINKYLVDSPTPFTVEATQLNAKSLSSFDYIFAGLLGFAIVGIGIFGPISFFPSLKKQGVLRRLHTTPLRVWQYFLANVLAQVVLGLMTVALMLAVAVTVFDLKLVGNVVELAIFLVFSIAMILGIGLAVGGWARNEQQAAPLANIIVFPMMFLSGTFFPRFLMPEWLQNVSAFLPLTPVIDGIRLIATEGKHLIELGPQVALVLGWTAIIYIIAFRVFRWE